MSDDEVDKARNTVVSHKSLVAALMSLHRQRPCFFCHDVDRSAVSASAVIRALLAKVREVAKDMECKQRVRSKAPAGGEGAKRPGHKAVKRGCLLPAGCSHTGIPADTKSSRLCSLIASSLSCAFSVATRHVPETAQTATIGKK